MQKHFIALALLFAACFAIMPASADSPSCNRIFNGFGDELDELANRVEKIKEMDKLCSFLRNTSLPLYQSIYERSRPLVGQCEHGSAAFAHAKSSVERETARMQEICAKAGM